MAASPKVGLVTGGGQGIGKAVTGVLLREGYKVAILDINETLGKETAEEFSSKFGSGSCVFYKCDVTDSDQLKQCYADTTGCLGNPSVVVNNAGIADEVNWTRVLNINLKAYIDMTYIAVDGMRKDKGGNGGTIVNVASIAGLQAVTGTPAYCASKWAVVGFTQSMAASLALAKEDWGITMLTLCPVAVNTSFGQSSGGPREVAGGGAEEPGETPGGGAPNPAAGIALSPAVPHAECRQVFVEFVQKSGILSVEEIGEAFKQLFIDGKQGAVMTASKELEGPMKLEYVQQEWKQVQ